MLTKNVQNTLVGYWIAVQFNSATFSISMASIEQDTFRSTPSYFNVDGTLSILVSETDKALGVAGGRKQKKVQRALVDAGYLNVVNGVVEVTSKAFDELKAEEPDMFKIWESNNRHRSECIAMVAKDRFSNEQLAYVLAHKDDFKFYVFTHDDVVYGYQGDRVGPCTFEQCGAEYKAMIRKSSFINRPVVMITTDALEKQVNDCTIQKIVNDSVSVNLAWGLVHQGILEQSENEDEQKENFVFSRASSFIDSFHNTGNLGNDPTKWNETLNKSIVDCETRIKKLQTTLSLLEKIRKGIDGIGGMDQFVQKMKDTIEKATIDKIEKER